nr:MAG TPA: Putative Fe-S cluster [Caudoviricetes sp.]
MSEYSLSDMRAAMGGNCGYDGCGTFGGGGNGLL